MTNQQLPPTNQSPAWMQSALATAVIASLLFVAVLIQRFFNRLLRRTVIVTPEAELRPLFPDTTLPPTLSEHAYNPDYDYHIQSPPWGRSTKIFVAVIFVILVGAVALRFESLIAQLVIAAILAYILNPIINLIDRHTKVSRGTVLLFTYLLLGIVVIWGFVSLGVAVFAQLSDLIERIPELLTELAAYIQALTTRTAPLEIGPLRFESNPAFWTTVQEQLVGLTQPMVSRGGQLVGQILTGTVGVVGNLLFIFVLSIYIAIEIPKLSGYVGDFAQTPGYRRDAERLMREFGRIWSAYLRGQVILGLTIGIIVWIGLLVLGVENSGALGLLSGLLEFIPIIGPVIGAAAAMIVGFFQPDHCQGIFQFLMQDPCPLAGWQFLLIVLGLMFVVQQLENNILVPRIVGEALDLHPLVVMISVFMGGSLAGILGAILAAPLAATLKLIGIYVWRKMFDDYPFRAPEMVESLPAAPPTTMNRMQLWLNSLRNRV